MPLRDITLFTQFVESSPELSTELTPSLTLPQPNTIEVCERLPSVSNKSGSLTLSVFEQEVAQQRGLNSFTWAASHYVPEAVKLRYQELIKTALPPAETIAELDRLIKNPPPLLIADMGTLGYGLFAKAKIRKGTPVCTYMGRLIPSDRSWDQSASRIYTVGVRTSSFLTAVFQIDTDKAETDTEITIDPSQLFPAFIDGSQYGNYGSFLQHLPSEQALAQHPDKTRIATANLITVGADYRHYPCYYFRAARDIEANEMLGFDYGENYWKEKNTELVLLNKFGVVL